MLKRRSACQLFQLAQVPSVPAPDAQVIVHHEDKQLNHCGADDAGSVHSHRRAGLGTRPCSAG